MSIDFNTTREDLNNLVKKDLMKYCSDNNLSTKGNKDVLVDRVMDYLVANKPKDAPKVEETPKPVEEEKPVEAVATENAVAGEANPEPEVSASVPAPVEEQKIPEETPKVEEPKQEQPAPVIVEEPKQEQPAPVVVEEPKKEQPAPVVVEEPKQEQPAPVEAKPEPTPVVEEEKKIEQIPVVEEKKVEEEKKIEQIPVVEEKKVEQIEVVEEKKVEQIPVVEEKKVEQIEVVTPKVAEIKEEVKTPVQTPVKPAKEEIAPQPIEKKVEEPKPINETPKKAEPKPIEKKVEEPKPKIETPKKVVEESKPQVETPKPKIIEEKIETPKPKIVEEKIETPQKPIETISEQPKEVEENLIVQPKEGAPAQKEDEEEEEEEYDENKVFESVEGENNEGKQNESITGDIKLDSENNAQNSQNSNGKPSFYSPIDEIEEKVLRIKKAFFNQKPTTRSYAWRLDQLKKMKKMMEDKKKYWYKAMKVDLKQTDFLCLLEVQATISEIDYAIENLKDWMNPVDKKSSSMMTMGAEWKVFKEPYGTALIIAPWNYPIQLALKPLVGAIAAGNCAVIKPSEVSEACSQLIAKLIPEYLDQNCFTVVQGGVEETTKLLECKFDYIFYTGNPQVAKIVMEKAAKHLTPVTLELGGKSPVYIHHDTNVSGTAKRIMWAKTMNCGQTCVAPDYLLVHKKVFPKLKAEFLKVLKSFFGDNWEEKNAGNNNKINMQVNDSYSRIISKRHTKRLKDILGDLETNEKNFEKLCGGSELVDEEDCFVPPTLIVYDQPKSQNAEFFNTKLMQEEIFGPILPIIVVEDEFEALNFIAAREKPLASYVFTKSKEIQQLFILNSSSGGMGINECVMHLASPEAPFGGVGNSGMGQYNGKYSFDTFSHEKSVMIKKFGMEPSQRFPPYTKKKIDFLEAVVNTKGGDISSWFKTLGSTINYYIGFKASK